MERLCLASLVIVSVLFFVEATTPDCPPGVGERCGGFTGKRCRSGLVCKLKSSFPDFGGICVPNRIGNVGDCCGGHSGKYCTKGLFCKFGSRPGANGRCVPRNCNRDNRSEGGFGEYCNFFTSHHCERSYECYPTGEIVDDGGICLPKDCGGRVPGECGDQCGTIAGLTCKSPLVCVLEDPEVSDSAGTCLPRKKDNCEGTPGAEGLFCGGIAGFPCPHGFECKLDGSYPDAGGKCIRIREGLFCGGIAGIPCPKGFECKLDGSYPDAGGKCIRIHKDEGAGPGEPCGGFLGIVCRHDLECKLDGNYPDAGGKCCAKDEGAGPGECCGGKSGKSCRHGLVCKLDGNYPGAGGKCCGCDKSKGEFYSDCGSACIKTCQNYKENIFCIQACVKGCFCPPNKVRLVKDGPCVNIEDCPRTACPKECDKSKGEHYSDCGILCNRTCDNYKFIRCSDLCGPGCFCESDEVRNSNGTCVKTEDCEKTGEPGELGCFCGGIAGITCRPGLICKTEGVYPDAGGTCVEDDRCDKRKGEVWLDCGSACPLTCENYKDKNRICTLQCVIGCGCPSGTVRRKDGYCVKPEDCWKRAECKSEE